MGDTIEQEAVMGFFDRIKEGLRKTKESTGQNLNAVFATFRSVDEDLLEELEKFSPGDTMNLGIYRPENKQVYYIDVILMESH